MKLYGNARLTPHQRELLGRRVDEEGWTTAQAAEAAGSERTGWTWLARWRADEPMTDRSSTLTTVANRTPAYNERRPHGAFGHKPPLSRLAATEERA